MTDEIKLTDIMNYFGGYKKLTDFAKDWRRLDDKSKEQIKTGIANGTFDY